MIVAAQFSTPHPVYILGSPSSSSHVLSHPNEFGKPVDDFRYQALNLFGEHIVTQPNGPEHRRHKSVVKACFGEEIMRAAWNNAVRSVDLMIGEEELEEGGIMENVRRTMLKASKSSLRDGLH